MDATLINRETWLSQLRLNKENRVDSTCRKIIKFRTENKLNNKVPNSRLDWVVIDDVLVCFGTGTLSSKFYMRDYSKKSPEGDQPDFRTTIYWDPNVNTTNDGAVIWFYAADFPGKYRIVLQGLSAEGQRIYGEKIIEVKE